jgi:DNA-binding MarR family transcriptional regulator
VSALHGALLDIVTAMNRPQRDEMLIRAAGVDLDQALFRLLIGIARFGPVGVVEIAERVGRDYSTVSRQVAKLEGLGLVARAANPGDRRVRTAVLTEGGRAIIDRLDAARARMMSAALADWPPGEIDDLVHLLRKFADVFTGVSPSA